MSINPLSRETSPHTNQTITGTSLSRETGPHPNKSMKKLAQALKKRAKHEAERSTYTPHHNCSHEKLTEALKRPVKTTPQMITKETCQNFKTIHRTRQRTSNLHICRTNQGTHRTTRTMREMRQRTPNSFMHEAIRKTSKTRSNSTPHNR